MSRRALWIPIAVALAALSAETLADDGDRVPADGGRTLDLSTTEDVSSRIHEIYARFDHRTHEQVFAEQQLGCLGCHQLGGRTTGEIEDAALDSAYLTPPPAACHYCHNPADGREPIGPDTCFSCHQDVPPPDSHGVDWREWHGVEARMSAKPCELCHRRSECVDCHVKRDPMQYRAHDRSWLAIHGIAAFVDPAECSTCHLQSECVACHATNYGRSPW